MTSINQPFYQLTKPKDFPLDKLYSFVYIMYSLIYYMYIIYNKNSSVFKLGLKIIKGGGFEVREQY